MTLFLLLLPHLLCILLLERTLDIFHFLESGNLGSAVGFVAVICVPALCMSWSLCMFLRLRVCAKQE